MEPSDRRQHARVPLSGRMVGRATVMTDFRVVTLAETGACLETRPSRSARATTSQDERLLREFVQRKK